MSKLWAQIPTWAKWVLRIFFFPLWWLGMLVRALGILCEYEVEREVMRRKLFSSVVVNRCRTCGTLNYHSPREYVGTSLVTGEYVVNQRCVKCGGTLFLNHGDIIEEELV